MISSWTIAVLPLLGVIVGATLQYWLGRAADRQRRADDHRLAAYADYLQAVAASAHPRSAEELRDAFREAADAKSRIAIYGSDSVVEALARFERSGASLAEESARQAFVSLISAMRGAPAGVKDQDLRTILLGSADAPELTPGTHPDD